MLKSHYPSSPKDILEKSPTKTQYREGKLNSKASSWERSTKLVNFKQKRKGETGLKIPTLERKRDITTDPTDIQDIGVLPRMCMQKLYNVVK